MRSLSLLLASCWLGFPNPAHAAAITYTFEQGVDGYAGFDDTTVFSESDNAGGGTPGVFSGTINSLTFAGFKQNRRTLIRAGLEAIAPGSIVLEATLEMTVEMSGANFGDIDFALHRVTADWGEGNAVGPSAGGFGAPAQIGDATWTASHFDQALWTTPGGDFVAAPSAIAPAGTAGSVVSWSSPGLADDIQAWLDNPASNRGWIVISASEGTRQRVKKFYSSESVEFRPVLTVIAVPPPPMPAVNSLGITVLFAALVVLTLIRILRSRDPSVAP